jgi:5-methylcytosine-specific restriction protein A
MESDYIVLVSGDIHRELGGYPGKNHNTPSCCSAMRSEMINSDKILYSPKKGNGSTLKICYYRRK